MCHYPQSPKTVFIRVNRCLKNEIVHSEPIPSSLCGCLDLCESAQSAIPFRFAQLNIGVLILLRISCFVFRILSSLCFLLPPAGALHVSRLLYKSPCFLQNKANFKMGKMTISPATTKPYLNEQRTMNSERHPKQSQFKPNPSPKLDLCSTLSEVEGPSKPNFKRTNSLPSLPDESLPRR